MAYAVAIDDVKASISDMAAGEKVCQPFPVVLDGSMYRHSVYGYTVTLPKGSNWTNYTYDDGTVVFAKVQSYVPSTKDFHLPSGVFIYVAGLRGDYSSLAAYLDAWIQVFQEVYAGLELLSTRPVCVPMSGVNEAYEVEAIVTRERTEFRERWLLFFAGPAGYFIEGFAWPEEWERYEKYIDTVLYSFGL